MKPQNQHNRNTAQDIQRDIDFMRAMYAAKLDESHRGQRMVGLSMIVVIAGFVALAAASIIF